MPSSGGSTLASGETLSTQFLIAATGFLCQPRTPDIPGIETFLGASFMLPTGMTATRSRTAGGSHRNRIHWRAGHS